MTLSNAEKQRRYKERLYEKGYRQKMYWVKPDDSASGIGIEKFMKQLSGITEGIKKKELSVMLRELLVIARAIKYGVKDNAD